MLLLLSLALAARAADDPPEVKTTGVVFAHYGLDLTEGADLYNEFDIARAYLGAVVRIDPTFGAKVLFDADNPADEKYRVFVKHAWMEAKLGDGVKLRAGMIDTGYLPLQEQLLANRYVTKVMGDEQKLESTADFGVNVQGKAGEGLLDWHAGIFNGEGYGSPEVDGGKTAALRVSLDPLRGEGDRTVPVTGYVSYGVPDEGADARMLWAAAVGAKIPSFSAWAEVIGAQEGEASGFGYSATLYPSLPEYGGLMLRYDHFSPDTSVEDGGVTKILGGITHDFAPKVSLAATYERVTADADPDAPAHGAFLRWQAGW